MKQSHYAFCYELEDGGYVLFNAATGRLAACDATYASAYAALGAAGAGNQDERTLEGSLESDSSLEEANIASSEVQTKPKGSEAVGFGSSDCTTNDDDLSDGSPILQDLADAGFIVPDDANEVEAQHAAFAAARDDQSQLFLSIAPTYACNCRCAYCYEQDKATARSVMNAEVEEAIYAFVEERYAAVGFESLFVEWYGGDPQLCLDLVERMAARFISFCGEHGVAYDSMMLSNSTRIGANEAQIIADAQVRSILITVDGPEELHNARRPAIDVDNAYQAIMAAIDHLHECGVQVAAAMNTDKVNMARFEELRDDLLKHDVSLSPVLLNDYAHTYNCQGECRFCSPGFDLYTHEEFAQANYERMAADGFTAGQLRGLLSPADHFCSGQRHATYVIDAFGDVYKCDGWMGDKTRAIGSLLGGTDEAGSAEGIDKSPGANLPDTITFDPFEDPACASCKLLPLCMGNCSWERELTGWPCHPLKTTLKRYLASYCACFPPRTSAFEVLA